MADDHKPIHHVVDTLPSDPYWGIFDYLFGGVKIPLLQVEIPFFGSTIEFTLTKFMILELIAAGLICAIFIPLARRAARGEPPTGAWWNAFESLLTFVRDQVAKPSLQPPDDHHEEHHAEGHDDHGHGHGHAAPDPYEYDKYVPFLWTLFLFILFCNLLGLLPFMGSPTASISVTGALALCAFVLMHGAAIVRMGPLNYLKSLWPGMEVPLVIGVVLKPMIFVIEVLGTVIKAGVLAVRLFANMFAGHMVLANILFFIVMAAKAAPLMWGGVTAASVLGVVALSLLELFVAFLQAYIFTFLTALFTGMRRTRSIDGGDGERGA